MMGAPGMQPPADWLRHLTPAALERRAVRLRAWLRAAGEACSTPTPGDGLRRRVAAMVRLRAMLHAVEREQLRRTYPAMYDRG